jgi:hypothetical protein
MPSTGAGTTQGTYVEDPISERTLQQQCRASGFGSRLALAGDGHSCGRRLTDNMFHIDGQHRETVEAYQYIFIGAGGKNPIRTTSDPYQEAVPIHSTRVVTLDVLRKNHVQRRLSSRLRPSARLDTAFAMPITGGRTLYQVVGPVGRHGGRPSDRRLEGGRLLHPSVGVAVSRPGGPLRLGRPPRAVLQGPSSKGRPPSRNFGAP